MSKREIKCKEWEYKIEDDEEFKYISLQIPSKEEEWDIINVKFYPHDAKNGVVANYKFKFVE